MRVRRRVSIALRGVSVGQKKILDYICRPGTYGISRGEAMSVLTHFAEAVEHFLSRGNSVRIDELGLFSLSLGMKEGKEAEDGDGEDGRRNAQSICISAVNFRADKRLLRHLNEDCPLERGGTSRINRSPYTREQRLQLAKDFMRKHTVMRISDYVSLTRLSATVAGKELREFTQDESSGITSTGRRASLVYILGN